MTVDFEKLEKLDRIEEQAATAHDALRSLFSRYRGRIESAGKRRQTALESAKSGYRSLSLAELATVSHDELKAADVDMAALAAAFRDLKAADELRLEHERLAAANREAFALLQSLRTYVGRNA